MIMDTMSTIAVLRYVCQALGMSIMALLTVESLSLSTMGLAGLMVCKMTSLGAGLLEVETLTEFDFLALM